MTTHLSSNFGRGSLKNMLLSSVAAFLVAPVYGSAANAQSAADETDEAVDMIVITGSRIPRAGFETLQPASVLQGETLNLRGSNNLADVLNEQVSFGLPGNSPIGGQNGDTIGANTVNYFGLGAQRTLTLVNGQRFPATSNGALSVDLNTIPNALVDRVETIAIGGAPIYGADAIAGTVNVILKDDFEGLEAVASFGISPKHGDAEEYRIGATYGMNFADGRGNVVFSGEFSSVSGLLQSDRPVTAGGFGFESPADPNSPFDQILIPDPTVSVDSLFGGPLFFGNQFGFNVFGNGIPLDINDPNAPLTQFDRDGNLIPFIPGTLAAGPIFLSGGDGLDLNELASLFTDLDRYSANFFVTYDVTDSIRFKTEGWFARTKATELVNQPDFNSPAFGGLPGDTFGSVGQGPIPVLIDNPFLPAATRATILEALNVRHDTDMDGLADPTIDTDGDGTPDAVGFYRFGSLINLLGDARDSVTRDTYRAVFGFDGDVALGDRDYVWDLNYSYGRTESVNSYLDIHQPHFELAVQVVDDGNGNPVCFDPSDGCVPLNVVGQPTQEARDYVTFLAEDTTIIEQHVIAGNIGGDLFDLPAGPVGAATGLSYRVEKSRFEPNLLSTTGATRGGQVPLSGKFNSKEFYGEMVIPVLGGNLDTPLVERLEIEGAFRIIDNSIAGSDVTWTAGGRYQPVEDIILRGNVTTSIRAPSITELFTPSSPAFAFAQDPCDARFIGQGLAPATRAANCAAAGITQPFTSFIVNASQLGTTSGNQNLSNEKAKSWTVGGIIQPRFVQGLSVAIDWLDIDIEGAIENLSIGDLLNSCFDSPAFPNEPSCSQFTRNTAGQIADFQQGFVNVGVVNFSGLQTVVNYNLPVGDYGDIAFGVSHLYTKNHTEISATGVPNRQDGEIGRSKHRINGTVTWDYNKFTWFNQFRWINGAVFNNDDGPFTRDVRGIGDWFSVDTSISYDATEQITMQLNIDNLFNRKPPFAAVASGNSLSTYFSGIMGRYVRFTVRGSF